MRNTKTHWRNQKERVTSGGPDGVVPASRIGFGTLILLWGDYFLLVTYSCICVCGGLPQEFLSFIQLEGASRPQLDLTVPGLGHRADITGSKLSLGGARLPGDTGLA